MINKALYVLVVLAFAKAVTSCTTIPDKENEIKAIPVDVELVKFHEIFAQSTAKDLPRLKREFSQFFPRSIADSIWIEKLEGRDTINEVLDQAIQKADFNYKDIEQQVELVMKHVEYYFPEFDPVPVYTVVSEVDSDLKVIPTPEFLLIGIDNYLGADHYLYKGINRYKAVTLERDRLPADVALAYSKLFIPPTNSRVFMEQMIYYGKLHYIQQQFVPTATAAQLMGYSVDKATFAAENEEQIYRYFIDKEMFYDQDPTLKSRFLSPGPFSKFYLEIDQQTPGAIARYVGFKIVESYASNLQVTLQELINTPASDIFKNSRYKPRS